MFKEMNNTYRRAWPHILKCEIPPRTKSVENFSARRGIDQAPKLLSRRDLESENPLCEVLCTVEHTAGMFSGA